MAFVRICYDTNFETLKIDYFKQLPQTLELLSKFLGDRPYFAGLYSHYFFSHSLNLFVNYFSNCAHIFHRNSLIYWKYNLFEIINVKIDVKLGDSLTYVDFLAYEYLDQQKLFAPDIVSKFDNLVQFLARFESLPTIAKYMKSDKFIKWPLNNDSALFGSRLQKI